MSTPTALLVSCSASVDGHEIVKKISQCDDQTPVCPIAEDVQGYPWQLSNKYYTADVLLCVAKPCVMGSLTLGDSMEGIVIVMDDQEPSFKSAKSQWSTVKEMNPEVRILACKQFTKSPGARKQDVVEWCLDHAFELVELEKPEDEEEEEEDGFGVEPYGVQRIISALHAHTWSNLEMKDDNGSNLLRLQERFGEGDNRTEQADPAENENRNGGYERLPDGNDPSLGEHDGERSLDNSDSAPAAAEAASVRTSSSEGGEASRDGDDTGGDTGCHGDNVNTKSCDAAAARGSSVQSPSDGADGGRPAGLEEDNAVKPDRIDAMLNEETKLFEALGNEDPGGESFELLFSRMASMKEKASSLEGEERRRYAEKVAIAFWRAVGGDEEEIDGLDDDSD